MKKAVWFIAIGAILVCVGIYFLVTGKPSGKDVVTDPEEIPESKPKVVHRPAMPNAPAPVVEEHPREVAPVPDERDFNPVV